MSSLPPPSSDAVAPSAAPSLFDFSPGVANSLLPTGPVSTVPPSGALPAAGTFAATLSLGTMLSSPAVSAPTGPAWLTQATQALDTALGAPASDAAWAAFLAARRTAAAAIAQLDFSDPTARGVTLARSWFLRVCDSAVLDVAVATEDVALRDEFVLTRPGALMAALTLSAPWQWPQAPALEQVPDALWADYARWLFTPPQRFTAPGQADAYAAFLQPRLAELAGWAQRNLGSPVIRGAFEAFVQRHRGIAAYFNDRNLRTYAEAVARLYGLAYRQRGDIGATVALPREGRRLRIGFLNRHFGPQTETYTTLPTFEHLDAERFDVVLFTLHEDGSALEAYCRQRAHEFHVLPRDLPSQLTTLRAAGLDVLVYGTNLTAVCHELVRLALHRIAPLQVVNNSSCITTGLPEIDLYVSGTLTETADAAAQFSERLGLIPGPAHAFNYEADQQQPTTVWTRASLGLPEDAVVFASAANYYKLIPEMQHTWARLLRDTPGSHLVVHPFNPNWSNAYPMARFCAELDRVLTAYGVDPARVVVSDQRFPSRTDVKELLRVADVYLDTFPFGGVNSLVDPLELGLPVIVWEGKNFRSRMGAALLRSLGLETLIASDEAGYLALARRLGTDAALRADLRLRTEAAMAASPVFLDTIAASDAFGDLVETAYDELVAVGPSKFRRNRHPLRAATATIDVSAALSNAAASLETGDLGSALQQLQQILRVDPRHLPARRLLGRALLHQGRSDRAVLYLLSALQGQEEDAALWFDLAQAFRANHETQQALRALETSLRLDAQNIPGWEVMAALAEEAGSAEIAAEAREVARQLAAA